MVVKDEIKDFKLLAIRPLIGCDDLFLRVLKINVIYKFYNGYTFFYKDNDENKEVIDIQFNSNVPKDLYYIKSGSRKLPINMSAVVGKNGAGKSVLFEMLYMAIYNFSVHNGILKTNEEGDLLTLVPDFAAEVYFEINGFYYRLIVRTGPSKGNRPKIRESIDYDLLPFLSKSFPLDDIEREIVLNKIKSNELVDLCTLDDFFYTIAINYSIHGLNSKQIGLWIKNIFHKNDGYQTPIVLNPYRNEGNININIENTLSKQRLLVNILQPVADENELINSLRCLSPGKVAFELLLKIDTEKNNKGRDLYLYAGKHNSNECVGAVFAGYTGLSFDDFRNDEFYEIILDYANSKLIYICERYIGYTDYCNSKEYTNIDSLVDKFCKDDSHVTYKLKQAFNFLRFRHLSGALTNKYFRVNINDLSKKISAIKETETTNGRKISAIELIPPSIFKIHIKFTDSGDFEDFSSGEKQKIFSTNTIVYHLLNINSVFKSKNTELHKYQYVNILFDEIELYFHPEFQKTFISDLIELLEKVNPSNLEMVSALNICFATHSPFILSDIPNENVLYLNIKDNKSYPKIQNSQTFGANIHDLLANDFFMQDGFMGEWAKKKIEETIQYLNYRSVEVELSQIKEMEITEENKTEIDDLEKQLDKMSIKNINQSLEYHESIIELIGEPIIKNKIKDMFANVLGNSEKERLAKKRINEIAKSVGINIEFKN